MSNPYQIEAPTAADIQNVDKAWARAAGMLWDLARGDIEPPEPEAVFVNTSVQVGYLADQTVCRDVRWSAMALQPFVPILEGWMKGVELPPVEQVAGAYGQLTNLLTETAEFDPQAEDLVSDQAFDVDKATARHYLAAGTTIAFVMRGEDPERIAPPEHPGDYELEKGYQYHRLAFLQTAPNSTAIRHPDGRRLGSFLIRSAAEYHPDALPPIPEEIQAAPRLLRGRWAVREAASLVVAEIASRRPGSGVAPLTDEQTAFLNYQTRRQWRRTE